ncbi:isocitrate lyase/phosphoenolpyruvate mutase family protein [Paractinoplanes durhamensis]|uniref:isocitrate lyase/phosphoenolpyruvate mutase family protein n=1 Tax=Paractinoplanes durhamensis TaxID=113563 RepID=UPI0036312BD1
MKGRLPIPLTVDIEAGFGGGPDEVADLAEALFEAGAAGINIEDGRPDGTLTAPAAQAELIAAIKARTPALFVNARTDTHWLPGATPPDLAETLTRARTYVEAGADGIFVPAVAADAEIRTLTTELAAPLNVLLLPGMTVPHLAGLGVARISTGSMLFRAALAAAVTTARAIAAGTPAAAPAITYAEANALAARDPADRAEAGARTFTCRSTRSSSSPFGVPGLLADLGKFVAESGGKSSRSPLQRLRGHCRRRFVAVRAAVDGGSAPAPSPPADLGKCEGETNGKSSRSAARPAHPWCSRRSTPTTSSRAGGSAGADQPATFRGSPVSVSQRTYASLILASVNQRIGSVSGGGLSGVKTTGIRPNRLPLNSGV